jgi:glycerate kinase
LSIGSERGLANIFGRLRLGTRKYGGSLRACAKPRAVEKFIQPNKQGCIRMKVICAPDSFKECLTAQAAAEAMARGVRAALGSKAEVDVCPIADGGEGTVDAMIAATGGQAIRTPVMGPYCETVAAKWGVLGANKSDRKTAVIEMAAAAGLELVSVTKRDPTLTTTFGVGQLIVAAMDLGATRIILGIGGSATTDGGCGAAQALGARFIDVNGAVIDEPIAGGMLGRIADVDLSLLDKRLKPAGGAVELLVACDVRNPLTGPSGAAVIYGPQKGASPAQVQSLDAGLRHLADVFRQKLGVDIETVPGAGAAGGMGGGTMAMLGAKPGTGVELVLDAVGFASRVRGCALCLTGEGGLDAQSMSGKACLGVAIAAGKLGVPTVALVGVAGAGAEQSLQRGLAGYRVIGPGLPAAESIRRAAVLLEAAAHAETSARLG